MWSGWLPWFFGFSFFHHFALLGLGTDWTETLEFSLLLLGDSCVGAVDSLCTSSVCWGTLFTWALGTTEAVLAGTVVFTAASFRCIVFLLYSPCGVFTIYDLGVSALDLTTPWLNLWPEESGTQTGLVGRRVEWISLGLSTIAAEVLPGLQGCSDHFTVLWRFDDGLAELFSSVCYGEALPRMVCYCWGELPSTLEDPLGGWYYAYHICWRASWWSGLASQWSHDLLGSEDCL